jgi:hypothetical protein
MEPDKDQSIFRQVWQDCWRSLVLFGGLLVGVIWLGSMARWLGLVLFALFAIVTLKDILRLLRAVAFGILVLPFTILAAVKPVSVTGPRVSADGVYLLNANAIVLMQLFVLVAYNLFLYEHFFITGTAPLP